MVLYKKKNDACVNEPIRYWSDASNRDALHSMQASKPRFEITITDENTIFALI